MKTIIAAILLQIIILSGCSMVVHVPASNITHKKQDTLLSGVEVAIIVPNKFESNAYQFEAAPIYLFPGFVDSLDSSLKASFKKVYLFKEQQFKPDDYPGNFVIIPNWEIERNNLNIKLRLKNRTSGESINIEDAVSIEKRSELRAFIYITSIFTVIGLPISMHIDKNDITHRVEVAIDKSISNLTEKLQAVMIKEMQRTEQRSAAVPENI